MTKTKQLLITVGLLIPLFMIMNQVADNSKNQIKSNLNLCELKAGERGFAKGQVTSVNKGDWGNKIVTIGEGTEGCRLNIKTNPNQNFLLQQVGNRVKVLVKMDTEYFASAIGDTAKEDIEVIDADGNAVPIESIEQTMSLNILTKLKKYEEATLNVAYENTSYRFKKEILNQLEPKKPYKWYYQTSMSGLRIVNRVEPVK
ncbi:hypothetical protein [Nostoc sp. CALU 1950]|uniref:hypothetical protein n=1 Tax=Nostoc sp. CALU 1950 TaxID=3104321 RepID=UPI003EB73B96